MAPLATQEGPLRAFFIYSRKDKEIRDSLEAHLGLLKRSGRLQCFHDGEIVAGKNWEPEILEKLEKAHLIILMVSADALNSEYCDKELSRALKRHDSGTARIIPVLTRYVDWHAAPFAHIQILPRSEIPIAKAQDRDEALSEIATEIRRTLDDFTSASASRGHQASASTAPASTAPASEAQEILRQALESSGRSDVGKVVRKIKLLDGSDQKWLMDELVRRVVQGKKVSSAIAVFGAACEHSVLSDFTGLLNQLLRYVTIQEKVSLKAELLEAVPSDFLKDADPNILGEFFGQLIDIVSEDQFQEVNVITAPLVHAQDAIPEDLHQDYVEALIHQADSSSYQGAPAAREGLRDLSDVMAKAGLALLDADYLCKTGYKDSVREFVNQYRKLAPAKMKSLLRDYLSMNFREFHEEYFDA